MITIILIWFLLAKHYLCDYVLQNRWHIRYKGQYGHGVGVEHSVFHAIGTAIVLMFFTTPLTCVLLALFDGVTHYHIDWIKSNYGESNIQSHKFWEHLGADQLAHQFIYLTIAMVLL